MFLNSSCRMLSVDYVALLNLGALPALLRLTSAHLSQICWGHCSPAQRRGAFTALLDSASHCTPARLLEARLLLAEQDQAGAVALTGALLKSQPGHVEALVLRGLVWPTSA